MKIDYLPDGSPDCPILRLYDFDTSEAEHLQAVLAELAEGKTNSVALKELPFIEPLQNCSLTLEVGAADEGVILLSGLDFRCRLTIAGWKQVVDLVEPFLYGTRGFQWLDETSPISLLFTPNGSW